MDRLDLISEVTYIPHFLTHEVANTLATAIDATPWETTLSRRTQQYGYSYVHKSAVLNPEPIRALPEFLKVLATRLQTEGYFETVPDQVIVNEYEPGQGIGLHIDASVYFGPVVASISLLAPITMQFSCEETKREIWLEPGSLLVLKGVARDEWKHGIAARKTDVFNGTTIARARRISITFRTLLRR
jgi:alkylated DNA repair dioxygenase AlkB